MKQDDLTKTHEGQPEPRFDNLEVQHTVEPPNIDDTIERISQAIEMATAVKPRRHRCRVCGVRSCPHYEREYEDTHEEFNAVGMPDLGGDADEED